MKKALAALVLLGVLTSVEGAEPAPAQGDPSPTPAGMNESRDLPLFAPEFLLKTTEYIPAPCISFTYCGPTWSSAIFCPTASYEASCRYKPGCWVECVDGSYIFCPNAGPSCEID